MTYGGSAHLQGISGHHEGPHHWTLSQWANPANLRARNKRALLHRKMRYVQTKALSCKMKVEYIHTNTNMQSAERRRYFQKVLFFGNEKSLQRVLLPIARRLYSTYTYE